MLLFVCKLYSLSSYVFQQLMCALDKAYVISSKSNADIDDLLKSLGVIRSLLQVQAGPDEEEHMKTSLK